MNEFEVVAFILDVPERVSRFVQHYRAKGASRISLYIDAEEAEWPTQISGAKITHCGKAFWSELGSARPHVLEDRQRAIYEYHYKRAIADWILVVDCDEFVFGDLAIPDFLARVPTEAPAVRVATAEAVFSTYDDIEAEYSSVYFRLSTRRLFAPFLSRLLYRDLSPLFIRSLLGHAIGKQFVRTGLEGLSINIHHVCQDGRLVQPLEVNHRHNECRMYLGHYDLAGFEQWRSKWDRRIMAGDVAEMGRKREKQRDLYVEAKAKGPKAQKELFRRLYALAPWQIAVLRSTRLLVRKDIFRNTM